MLLLDHEKLTKTKVRLPAHLLLELLERSFEPGPRLQALHVTSIEPLSIIELVPSLIALTNGELVERRPPVLYAKTVERIEIFVGRGFTIAVGIEVHMLDSVPVALTEQLKVDCRVVRCVELIFVLDNASSLTFRHRGQLFGGREVSVVDAYSSDGLGRRCVMRDQRVFSFEIDEWPDLLPLRT